MSKEISLEFGAPDVRLEHLINTDVANGHLELR